MLEKLLDKATIFQSQDCGENAKTGILHNVLS